MVRPLTPAGCDLRSQDWFALEHKRLRRSSFWMTASDAARAISVDLWCEAYEQVPAGSIPSDERELALLAGFGKRGVEDWRAISEEVLAPWVLCDDGRYYHPVLCEVALKAWTLKLKDRVRKNTDGARALLDEAAEFLRNLETFRRNADGICTISSATGQDRTGLDQTGQRDARATSLAADFVLPIDWIEEALTRASLSRDEVDIEWQSFSAYWCEQAAKPKGKKRDWKRTWINYVTSDICQNRVAARRRNYRESGSVAERAARRYV